MPLKKGDVVEIKGIKIRVLITEQEIQDRVYMISKKINQDYRDKKLVMIFVLTGSMFFMADLSKNLDKDLDLIITSIDVESYGSGTKTSGILTIFKGLNVDIAGCDVVIVEDLVDSGFTLANTIAQEIEPKNPTSIRICCVLDKPVRRGQIPEKIKQDSLEDYRLYQKRIRELCKMMKKDYIGFEINEDLFVVGYGMDRNKKLRHLRFIGVIEK